MVKKLRTGVDKHGTIWSGEMEGCDGIGSDYADDDLRKLRAQESELEAAQIEERMSRQCENEKIMRRKRIRALGAKPCA